jgi:hypothetical protein
MESPTQPDLRGLAYAEGVEGSTPAKQVLPEGPWAFPPLPAEGGPSAKWMETVMAAERASLLGFLESRHQAMLSELLTKTVQAAANAKPSLDESKELFSEKTAATHAASDNEVGEVTVASASPPPKPTEAAMPECPGMIRDDAGSKDSTPEESLPIGNIVQSSDVKTKGLSRGMTGSAALSNTAVNKRNSLVSSWRHDGGTSTSSPHRSGAAKRGSKVSDMKSEWLWRMVDDSDDDRNFCQRLVTMNSFELSVSGLIMLNAFVMAGDMQYAGIQIGHTLGYQKYDEPAAVVWPSAETVFDVANFAFGILFTLELIVKVIGLKKKWIYDAWNLFDAVIVIFWIIEQPLRGVLTLPLDAGLLRTARVVKLMRLLRLIRALQGFDSLYLMTTTLKGSIWILGWSVVLIFTAQMLISFLLFFILSETYLKNEAYPIRERSEVFEYFGTFTRATLSLFELTLANWPPVCRLLVENVSEWFMLFFLAHKLTIGFAVIGVINGVFMQETFKVAASDDRIMVRQRERDVAIHVTKMRRLFEASDDNGDGSIDLDEFHTIMEDAEILTWLASMEVTVRDPETFFRLLDTDGDGTLTLEELVKGVMKLRGLAKSVDLLTLRQDVDRLGKYITKNLVVKKQV